MLTHGVGNALEASWLSRFRLRGLDGPYKKQKFPFKHLNSQNRIILLGSDRDCDISIGRLTYFESPEEQHHIASIHGGFFVNVQNGKRVLEYHDFGAKETLGEGYVSMVNGEQVEPHQNHNVQEGDILKIGDLTFRLEVRRNILMSVLRSVAAVFGSKSCLI